MVYPTLYEKHNVLHSLQNLNNKIDIDTKAKLLI
jgi:hypothetical protein